MSGYLGKSAARGVNEPRRRVVPHSVSRGVSRLNHPGPRTRRRSAPRIVAIAGGAQGIGWATAQLLLRRGDWVAIGDADVELVGERAHGLGVRCLGVDLDVTSAQSFESFLDRADAELGPVDVLVNCAAATFLGPALAEPHDVTRRIVDVNLIGVINGTRAAGARMAARGGGGVVNVGAPTRRGGLAQAATYTATKYAVVGFSAAVRAELRNDGVQVSWVAPALAHSQLGTRFAPAADEPTDKPAVAANELAETIVRAIDRQRRLPIRPEHMTILRRGTRQSPSPDVDSVVGD